MRDALDAVFFVEHPPTIVYRDGLFHVGYKVGTVRTEFVMPPSVYFKALASAVEESRKHGRNKNIIPLHAAASGNSGK